MGDQPKPKELEVFRLEPFDRARLREVAKAKGKKPATLIREVVQRYLDTQTVKSA